MIMIAKDDIRGEFRGGRRRAPLTPGLNLEYAPELYVFYRNHFKRHKYVSGTLYVYRHITFLLIYKKRTMLGHN